MKPTIVSLLASFVVTASAAACLDPTDDGNLVPSTVDGDPSLPRLELNGSVFHAETFGDPTAPVIVMLHGGPGSDYRSQLRLRQPVDGVRLEDRHFVVFWDQRGTGLSRRHDPRDLNLATYEDDLLAILERFAPGRPAVLVGHSWGCMYASHFIGRHPERVAGAVLMDAGPLTGALYEEVKDEIVKFDFASEWLNDYTWGQATISPDGHARADYVRMLGKLGDNQPGYHLSATDHEPSWRFGAVANAAMLKEGMSDGKAVWDFTKGLDRYQRPVLFVGSELNEVIGAAFQRRQMAAYPSAELAVIAGAGHDHQWTHPEATLRPIFSYLAAIGF
jgi:proline iminopeptidase